MTRQQLREILPARSKCVWDDFWDERLKEQIESMIFPEHLKPKEYQVISPKHFDLNGHSFDSTLKIKNEFGWFYVETENSNGNSLLHDRDNSVRDILCEHETDNQEEKTNVGDREEGAVKKPDAANEGVLQPIQYNPELSKLVASGNLNLPDTMITQFLASIDVELQTKVNYQNGLKKLQEYSRTKQNWYTPAALIEFFKKDLLDSGLETSSINTHMIPARRLFRYLFNRGLIPINPMDELRNYKPKESRREAFTQEEILKLLETIKSSDRPENILIRDYTMVRLIAKTGLREVSVQNACFKDIGFKDGKYILWVKVKGRKNKDKYSVLLDNLVDDINNCNVYSGQQYIFVGHGNKNSNQQLTRRHIRKIITRHMEQAGIKTPANCVHAIRNYFAKELLKNGATLPQVQLAMHHTDPKTTMGYAGDLDRINNPAESFITGI